jgi:hypothetical protein
MGALYTTSVQASTHSMGSLLRSAGSCVWTALQLSPPSCERMTVEKALVKMAPEEVTPMFGSGPYCET